MNTEDQLIIKKKSQLTEVEIISNNISDKEFEPISRYREACKTMSLHAIKILEYTDKGIPTSFWLLNGNALRLTAYSIRNANINFEES